MSCGLNGTSRELDDCLWMHSLGSGYLYKRHTSHNQLLCHDGWWIARANDRRGLSPPRPNVSKSSAVKKPADSDGDKSDFDKKRSAEVKQIMSRRCCSKLLDLALGCGGSEMKFKRVKSECQGLGSPRFYRMTSKSL